MEAGDSSSKSRGLDKGEITEELKGPPFRRFRRCGVVLRYDFALTLLILLICDHCCPRQRS